MKLHMNKQLLFINHCLKDLLAFCSIKMFFKKFEISFYCQSKHPSSEVELQTQEYILISQSNLL